MFNLQQTLEQRLAVLTGNPKDKPNDLVIKLDNVSKNYITHSLTQAGILDEQGNIRNLKISD